MSARRTRSRSGGGAAGERGGGGARRSNPATPVPPTPTRRRSQRKSGPTPEAPPQPSAPALRKTITLKKIAPQTPEATTPRVLRSIAVKKLVARTPEAASPAAHTAVSLKEIVPHTPIPHLGAASTSSHPGPSNLLISPLQTPTPQGRKSAAKKKASPSTEKENAPPVQENAPLDPGSSAFTAGPVLDMSTTVLGSQTPSAVSRPDLMDARDLEMSQKVRRSYSRLDDSGLGSGSTSTPNYYRRSYFGFERLLSGEELENVSPVVKRSSKPQAAAPATTKPWGLESTLPGIPIPKEKRQKRKAPKILVSELDEWAAAMNAQFEAAEKFELLVE